MSEPEQCIICLDPLPRPETLDDHHGGGGDGSGGVGDAVPVPAATVPDAVEVEVDIDADINNDEPSYLNIVAALDGCNHIIHDVCIRSWAQKTNTCPICRNPFHSVRVYNGVDGTIISTYDVQDKKQVAEFDVQQWLGDNPDEEEEQGNPCPVCNSAEQEDVLLLCDSCDAAYHTHCVGLECIPDGDWYCMECSHLFQLVDSTPTAEVGERSPRPHHVRRPNPRNVRGYHVRTRERLRRARRQARNVEWQGAWGQFSGRFYEMSELDLDNHDDEDEELEQFRRFQELGRRELDRWQQRMDIAHRLGASEVFVNNIPPAISERLHPIPEPVQETRDERRAWGALERAREVEEPVPATNSRKRKVRSVSASPREPVQEPERKLKRPRTRRLTTQNGEGSSSMSSPAAGPSIVRPPNGTSSRNGASGRNNTDPPLVSSLLKELEPNGTSEDETSVTVVGWRHPPDASSPAISPAISPSPSAYSSPRALSLTPPPLPSLSGRPSSPPLSLSTHIQPIYPPANYSPNRRMSSDHSDSESRPRVNGRPTSPTLSPTLSLSTRIQPRYPPTNYSPTRRRMSSDNSDTETRPIGPESRPLELRQPRPRRPHQVPAQPEEQQSPTRWTMTQEEKRNINDIVKIALRPHWRAQKLTTEQYATINRDISRKLYDEVKDSVSLNGDARRSWEKRATKEVAQAMAELQA
ncbi:hypothetical protein B0J13DRAFT_615184 [Dactylonectria estremocensis]|uniref:PHD and RING finger domain-containing protein n=1 Tax=Dactylonectria estremocensis TaxID=1079267 RepID=A0A9P9JEG3_9HYPO|nr:hypothetical protein B0J13DRAFT_615184 [Dactylonectria estremocensis]